ncbi:gene transfer agent family protein [Altererythrobacter sp. MF3-039]|uniref:gene transfer agent family protein n=1 Tax=Altererythrobacter sp. MF3-039 TaxID=3252901 RepID=UPI00390C8119
MSSMVNKLRGEATLEINGTSYLLRPTFEALVLAEEELGPLFALVERAGEGRLKLSEMASLFWFCLAERESVSREAVGQAVAAQGLAQCAKPLRTLLGQILQGNG